MLQALEAEVLYESSILSDDGSGSRGDTISTQTKEYFNLVEAGNIPVVPVTNAHFISTMRNTNGETLLMVAAKLGHANVVANLVTEIDVEEIDNDGWTALLNAAHAGHAECVKLLLTAGASIDQSDQMGWTPLMWGCYKNHLDVVDVLVNAKAHVNIVGEEDGLTPLIIASGRGYTEIVFRLLEGGALVNNSDKFGSTALIWAARKGHLKIVEKLLESGAEIDALQQR